MAYADFLSELARVLGVESPEELVDKHADKFAFQIKSRERAKQSAEILSAELGAGLEGLRILDVGCAYGSHSIEYANLGASVVGIDVSDKWLALARANARDEVDVPFIKCDASARRAVIDLIEFSPFDVVVINDVFEHIFDTAGLLYNLRELLRPGAKMYYKVPNGLATRSVLSEGHKKIFGISLLAPDYWPHFTGFPFSIYYRRWDYFQAHFDFYGFSVKLLTKNRDSDHEKTKRFITNDLAKIRRQLRRDNFTTSEQLQLLRTACGYYFDEVATDLNSLEWDELFLKYRATFWEGILTYEPITRAHGRSVPGHKIGQVPGLGYHEASIERTEA